MSRSLFFALGLLCFMAMALFRLCGGGGKCLTDGFGLDPDGLAFGFV